MPKLPTTKPTKRQAGKPPRRPSGRKAAKPTAGSSGLSDEGLLNWLDGNVRQHLRAADTAREEVVHFAAEAQHWLDLRARLFPGAKPFKAG